MNQLLTGNFPTVSNDAVNGRGIKNQKLTPRERIALAADIATGRRPYEPSLAQACLLADAPVAAVRAEIKARSAANGYSEDVKRLVEAWNGLNYADRLDVIEAIGVVLVNS